MIQRCFAYLFQSGGRTFSVRTQGVANGLSHVVYRPGLIVRGLRGVFSNSNGGAYTKVVFEVLRKEEGEFERSTCMGVLFQTEELKRLLHDIY